MSVKRKKSGLISWQKSLFILAPWRKGKGARDTVLDSAVVLTKMKLFSNFNERLSEMEHFFPTLPASSEQKLSKKSQESLAVSYTEDKSGQHQTYANADYLPDIFSGSQLTSFYKFESEDSGVDLSSGNFSSTPSGSDQNFAVHSRESSCDSSDLNPTPPTQSDENSKKKQSTDISQSEVEIRSSASRNEPHMCEDLETGQSSMSPMNPENDEEMIEKLENKDIFKAGKQSLSETHKNKADNDIEPLNGSGTYDGFVNYMEKCCVLSETQQSSSTTLGSGLRYLEHICQLIEKIGQLQEDNLRLQRQFCCLQKDGKMTKIKEDFFQHHCSCGAATLALEDIDDILSRSGTLSDPSTIQEVSQHLIRTSKSNVCYESLEPRRLNRMSYNEADVFLCESSEGLSTPHGLGDYDTCSKDLMKRTKSKLGLSTSSLKMSCPQLYSTGHRLTHYLRCIGACLFPEMIDKLLQTLSAVPQPILLLPRVPDPRHSCYRANNVFSPLSASYPCQHLPTHPGLPPLPFINKLFIISHLPPLALGSSFSQFMTGNILFRNLTRKVK
ncbi:uncharacterized protein si:ch211-250c4.3 isoform X2 [Syngnathoides biaculeatus]|uniref:uncharacterized protein si:ch211-250c4.3 isoform X2 n=1 Tax=Syngnathoides biaculeatus TaxID=300417 RepID=UPI002ADD438E|nr:uncharacterized protein si:ch211-250c4.3 isoform X2 [Syngnathoides biaculeatus]